MNAKYTFAAKDVAREAIRLAANNPDAVYVSEDGVKCYYTRGEASGKPGCIFGQALRNLGVKNLDQFDQPGIKESLTIEEVLRRLGIAASPYDAARLGAAQSRQDEGRSWSEVVEPLAEMVKEVAK